MIVSNIFTAISFITSAPSCARAFWPIPVVIGSTIASIPPGIIRQCIYFNKLIQKKIQKMKNGKMRKNVKPTWTIVMNSLLAIGWNWHQGNDLIHCNIICDFIFETTSIMTTSTSQIHKSSGIIYTWYSYMAYRIRYRLYDKIESFPWVRQRSKTRFLTVRVIDSGHSFVWFKFTVHFEWLHIKCRLDNKLK